MREKEPTNHTANDVAGRKGDVEVERLDFGPSSGLEENDDEAKDRIAAENLGCPDDAVLTG